MNSSENQYILTKLKTPSYNKFKSGVMRKIMKKENQDKNKPVTKKNTKQTV